ncbi:cytochrome C oxidase subunit II [Virgibacillus profundi]|uniref:Cytochrome aa3 subunit 2 n=1 Tax=Virgibacillus profundi TaxID=2024555 RepID=A0A2A2IIW7_9BACI|nr:cytochrome C oxidase subunit II [Virgibacillus profundi]PAV31033.1 cytochrome C oxidase subunit II [Virgibacillus profundi]PXY55219.1 cytochrome C oxidase subunit II [Virgibacillus profundi]
MVQIVASITSLFFMLVVTAVFAFVAMKSREKRDYEPIKKKWYKARTFYGTTLVILFLVVTIYTLRELPYDQPVYGEENLPIIVDVEAIQFGWNMSETEFSVGEPIEFHVTSSDVTHGFGIYDEDKNLIAQTQAMPEYTNEVYITFEEPGTYEILCLEYCGLAHHLMIQKIEVK